MWGRGLRSSPKTGKTECILIDHSGNIVRFLEDFTDFYFNGLESLDDGMVLDKKIREVGDKEESKGCPSCGHRPFFKRCMSCGYEFVKPSLIEHVPGQMRVLEMPVMAGKKKLAESHLQLWQEVCAYASAHSPADKQMGRASNLYKNITGMWPPRDYTFSPSAEIGHAVRSKIRSLNIRYAKGIRRAG
jgi:DNA-directed RNA polymerase subunit RPC12/RpoP